MIRNQWYVVLDSNEVRKNRPVGVTRMGEKMVFWRNSHGEVSCLVDQCPHLGAPLSLGKIHEDHIVCPFHGFEYDTSGQCQYLPAYGKGGRIPKSLKAKSYPTYEAHGFIWIWWGDKPGDGLQPPAFFESIGDDFSHISFKDPWNVHYSRMAENQLDVAHLPFVHQSTIGRAGKMVVDGPYVQLENDLLEVWVYNRYDDGTPPRKAQDLPKPDRRPFLQFQYPNLWHNWIADDIRVLVAFVPVDEENSLFYGRFYQRVMRVPVLREAFNLAGKWGSQVIANQDKRVVTMQIPKKTALKDMGEKIMQSDNAILTYRIHRDELKAKAGQVE